MSRLRQHRRQLVAAAEEDARLLRDEIRTLTQQRTAFDLRVAVGSCRVIHDPAQDPARFYVVVADASITNASDFQVPIKVSLRIDLSEDAAISQVAKSVPMPDWAMARGAYGLSNMGGRFITLPARTASPLHYWAFNFPTQVSFVGMDPTTAHERPLWLELENAITQQVQLFALNTPAEIVRARRKTQENGEPPRHSATYL